MLARSKLNSIESKISEALINNEIKHEDFTTIIDEEKKYRELKESIRMMNNQRSDAEKNKLIEEGKKMVLIKLLIIIKLLINSLKTYKNEIILFKVQKRYRKYKSKSFKNK